MAPPLVASARVAHVCWQLMCTSCSCCCCCCCRRCCCHFCCYCAHNTPRQRPNAPLSSICSCTLCINFRITWTQAAADKKQRPQQQTTATATAATTTIRAQKLTNCTKFLHGSAANCKFNERIRRWGLPLPHLGAVNRAERNPPHSPLSLPLFLSLSPSLRSHTLWCCFSGFCCQRHRLWRRGYYTLIDRNLRQHLLALSPLQLPLPLPLCTRFTLTPFDFNVLSLSRI